MTHNQTDDQVIDIKPKRTITKKQLSKITLLLLCIIIWEGLYIAKLQTENQATLNMLGQEITTVYEQKEAIDFLDSQVAFYSPTDKLFHHYNCTKLNQKNCYPIAVDFANTPEARDTGLSPCPLCREEYQ